MLVTNLTDIPVGPQNQSKLWSDLYVLLYVLKPNIQYDAIEVIQGSGSNLIQAFE
jgi:hypothetical protein